MDNYRRDLLDLVIAVEIKDSQIERLIKRIKGGFNHQTQFKYGEALRRAVEKKKGGGD